MSLSSIEIREWLKEWRHTSGLYGEKLDRNGYAKSIMCDGTCCYRCAKRGDLARHEVYEASNRKTSKALGFYVTVCPECHEIYHTDREIAKQLKRECQERFELSHTREEFRLLVGRSYL